MEGFRSYLLEWGYELEPATILAECLWDIAQRLERTSSEQALAAWFVAKLNQ